MPICIPPFGGPLWWLAPPPLPPASGGTMGAGQWCSFACGTVVKENHTTGLRPSEMHPYWCCAPLLLKGSMSLDFRVALLPYKSSSFATPEGEVLAALCFVMLMSSLVLCVLLCPRTAGWQGNTIRRGAQRPENRVTRFTPWQRWCRKAPKGEKPPQVANSAGRQA